MAITTASTPPTLPATGFIRQSQLLRYIPVSPATLWRWCKKDFPAPIKLSERVTAWRCEDVRAWLEAQGADASQRTVVSAHKSVGA